MTLTQQLNQLAQPAAAGLFNQLARGIEKEALRTNLEGEISQTNHPKALGSTLTNPYITTDYSEALVEFITPVKTSRKQSLEFLHQLHQFSLSNLNEELLWPASMPCQLAGNSSVRIAEYGTSNAGRMRHVYRKGLDARYGRIMQSIAGIHYNFSLPEDLWPLLAELDGEAASQATNKDWRSAKYFGLIRNFRRYSWLLMYLYGASPAVDASFLEGMEDHPLEQLTPNTWGSEVATSLRMSDLGYQNSVQASLDICFNSLDNYINTLNQAISQPYPDYAELGVEKDGKYVQLSTGILQIENEYYSDIRPKRVALAGEKPNQALQARGVEYIEVRCLDINPFEPTGLTLNQLYFLDAFLIFCLLEPSPKFSPKECEEVKFNMQQVVNYGRQENLQLSQQSFATAAQELMQQLKQVAQLLDSGLPDGKTSFSQAVITEEAKLANPELTPSAQLLAKIKQEGGYLQAVLQLAKEQQQVLTSEMLNEEVKQHLTQAATESLAKQAEIETQPQEDFAQFLANYYQK